MNRKLVAIILIVIASIFLSTVWLLNHFVQMSYQKKTAELYQKTLSIQSDLISNSIRSQVIVEDFVNARMQLERLKVEGRIKKYSLRAADKGLTLQSEADEKDENYLYSKVKIFFKDGGDSWGDLELWFPSEEFKETIHLYEEHSNRILVLNIVLILFLFLILAIIFDKSSAPLTNFVTDMFDDMRERESFRSGIITSIWSPFLEKIEVKSRELNSLKNANSELKIFSIISMIHQNLAHDMRAPLGTFERLLSVSDSELPQMRESLRRSLNRLYAMIESLRNHETETLVKRQLEKLSFLFGCDTLAIKAEGRKVTFEVPQESDVSVYIDSRKVERAWLNLASNAIESASSFVKVETQRQGTSLHIRVIDDGPGVPSDIISKLFQRGVTHGKAGGTGLGLAYVRQIMQGHGGDVTYRRENGLTIFECILPGAYEKNEDKALDTMTSTPTPLTAIEPRKVAIKLLPEALSRSVCAALASFKSDGFFFSCELDETTEIIVINDDEVLMQAMDDGKEPLQLSKNLDQKQILDRLTRKFNLI